MGFRLGAGGTWLFHTYMFQKPLIESTHPSSRRWHNTPNSWRLKNGQKQRDCKEGLKDYIYSRKFHIGMSTGHSRECWCQHDFLTGKDSSSSSRRLPSPQYLQMNIPAFPFTFSTNCNSAIGKAETNWEFFSFLVLTKMVNKFTLFHFSF